jgi:hypothetical protein
LPAPETALDQAAALAQAAAPDQAAALVAVAVLHPLAAQNRYRHSAPTNRVIPVPSRRLEWLRPYCNSGNALAGLRCHQASAWWFGNWDNETG